MIIKESEIFTRWFKKLKDIVLVRVIYRYIQRLKLNNFSNVKSVGDGVHEIKIDYQKGYRIYFSNIDGQIILLLCGGDKSSQQKDIEKAKQIKKFYEYGGR